MYCAESYRYMVVLATRATNLLNIYIVIIGAIELPKEARYVVSALIHKEIQMRKVGAYLFGFAGPLKGKL